MVNTKPIVRPTRKCYQGILATMMYGGIIPLGRCMRKRVIAKPPGRRISKRNQKIWEQMVWGSSSPRADRGVQKALYILAFFPYSFERNIVHLSQYQISILENMLKIAMDRIKSNLCTGGLTSTMINSGLIKLTSIRTA
jgi:hypothetical protein